jgi:hypothetical protein
VREGDEDSEGLNFVENREDRSDQASDARRKCYNGEVNGEGSDYVGGLRGLPDITNLVDH